MSVLLSNNVDDKPPLKPKQLTLTRVSWSKADLCAETNPIELLNRRADGRSYLRLLHPGYLIAAFQDGIESTGRTMLEVTPSPSQLWALQK